MNHLGDTNKMAETPRTDAEYERLFEIYQNAERINGPLCCAFENDMRLCRQLERELNAANQIIRQQQLLEEENLRLTDKIKQLYEGAEEQHQRIKRLEEAGDKIVEAGWSVQDWSGMCVVWAKAKEAKP